MVKKDETDGVQMSIAVDLSCLCEEKEWGLALDYVQGGCWVTAGAVWCGIDGCNPDEDQDMV